MKELNCYPLTGLLVELQKTGSNGLPTANPQGFEGKESLKRSNSLFWAKHLEVSQLNELIKLARDRYRYSPCNIPQYRAILDDQDLFLTQIDISIKILTSPALSEKKFFSAMECLVIMCNLYSDFVYKPFRLTIDQGFLLDETDSRTLIEGCLNPVSNPYFNFINKHCQPVIRSVKPDLIWIFGQPTFTNFAMAMLAKKTFPDVHICLVDFPSEYYSLGKIKHFLKNNRMLFSVIDSILLNNDDEIRESLVQTLEQGESLKSVPNFMYIDREKDKIISTHSEISFKNVDMILPYFDSSYPQRHIKKTDHNSEVIALKMWPGSICYWNRCSFCGINQKYNAASMSDSYDSIDQKIDFIENLTNEGYQFFWMVDEAVPPDILKKFSDGLVQRKIKVCWQTRSRIDKGFTREVCKSLAKAGLKEIRFGLESANYRILKLMNKFPDDFHLSLVEQTVERFHREKVSVHLCLILDFPGETHEDRMETFNFLRYLKNKYPSVTFNLNRFMLDLTSKLFAEYDSYNIIKIEWPCPSKYFLGNQLGWDTENRKYHKDQIDALRNNFMRQNLYPWMPTNPMTPPFNFYMQYEAFMMTLIWKTKMLFKKPDTNKPFFSKETIIIKSDKIVCSKLSRKGMQSTRFYRVYIWDTHIHFECDEILIKLYDIFCQPQIVQEGLELFYEKYMYPSLSREEVFEKYYPKLEKAFNLNIVCLSNDNIES